MGRRSFLSPRTLRATLAAPCVAALTACGGGLWLSVGDDLDSAPPNVSLVAPASAQAGQTIRLTAAASDDFGVEQVVFFRVDGGAAVQLGADADAPYAFDTQVPAAAVGAVEYFARASDFDGHSGESASVSVSVTP